MKNLFIQLLNKFWLRMNFRISRNKHGRNRVAMSINFHLLFKDVFLFKYIVIWYKIISPYLKKKIPTTVDVVQSLSHVWLFEILWTAAHQAPLSLTISQSLLKLMSIGLMMLSNHLILCCPLICFQSFPPSGLPRWFPTSELPLHIRWPKNWSLGISPSNEYSELISFRTDSTPCSWRDSQVFSSTVLILRCSAFFMVQLSHSYVTYWKNHSFD